jgi:hypothetical protein
MPKNKMHIVIFGVAANLIFAVCFIAASIDYYKGWDTFPKVNRDNWLVTDEQFLHLATYGFFPVAATVMIVSAILIWKLRK